MIETKQHQLLQDTGKLLTPGIDSNELRRMGFKGEGIKRSKFDEKYRVFVQSKGSGARHLAHDSYIIYEQQVKMHILSLTDTKQEHAMPCTST